jgi:hypothetical protein
MSWTLHIAQIQFFPDQASKMADRVDLLFLSLIAITGTVAIAKALYRDSMGPGG